MSSSSRRTAPRPPRRPPLRSRVANTWTQVRTDSDTFGSRFGRWAAFYTVSVGATEAVAINFAANNPAFCQWVIFEIATGFDTGTPTASNNFTDTAASIMQADVGTLLDTQSIVLANGYKDSAASPVWPAFTAVFT